MSLGAIKYEIILVPNNLNFCVRWLFKILRVKNKELLDIIYRDITEIVGIFFSC